MRRLASRPTVITVLVISAACGLLSTSDAGTGLALLALASVPAVFAVPPTARPWLGGALVAIGAAAAALGDLGPDGLAWSAVATLSAGGVLIAVGGRRWPALSGRYDSTASGGPAPAADPTQLWQALDRGQDPTLTPPSDSMNDTGDDERPYGRPDIK